MAMAMANRSSSNKGKFVFFITCLGFVATFSGLFFGFDLGISGGVSSMTVYAAAPAASFGAAYAVAPLLGRRSLKVMSCAVFFLAGAAAALNYGSVLIVGRMLLAFGIGCANQLVIRM